MTRISENQLSRTLLRDAALNRASVNKYSEEISSGLKVALPGDSTAAGTISQLQDTLARLDGFKNRVSTAQGFLDAQDAVLSEAADLLVRAKEIATQAANETNGEAERANMAAEVYQLRDQLVALANTKYQGRFIYGGADDDDPPYDPQTYNVPATGAASQRYVFDAEAGTSIQRTVNITDDLSITVNTPGNQIFDNGIQSLERLGRALSGYDTLPTSGAPDGTGAAYDLPNERDLQTADIKNAISLIDTARETDFMNERVTVGGKLRRLETASSLTELSKSSAQEVLTNLQQADITESATNLTQAQTALQAALTVSARVLNQSILDYL